MSTSLKVASFHVRATVAQSARWKQAAEAEGFPGVGQWLACAADAYLRARARAGQPVPLAWRLGTFRAALEGGEEVVRGWVSPPFGTFRGTSSGPRERNRTHNIHTLVYLPAGRVLATMRHRRDCVALAADLARLWVRGDGDGPAALDASAKRYGASG